MRLAVARASAIKWSGAHREQQMQLLAVAPCVLARALPQHNLPPIALRPPQRLSQRLPNQNRRPDHHPGRDRHQQLCPPPCPPLCPPPCRKLVFGLDFDEAAWQQFAAGNTLSLRALRTTQYAKAQGGWRRL